MAASNGNSPDLAENGNPSSRGPSSTTSAADNLAQALKDLARGEQTATQLEASLTSLESKLDEILAAFGIPPEENEGTGDAGVPSGPEKEESEGR